MIAGMLLIRYYMLFILLRNSHMKHLLIITGISLAMMGCGDAGKKAIKGAAEAVLADDEEVVQQQPQQQPVNNQQQAQSYDNYGDPTNAQQQNGYIDNNGQGQTNNQSPYADSGALPPKPVPAQAAQAQQAAGTESVVRYRAQVLTQYGGKVVVRTAPSKNGRKLGFLYDQEEVWVVGETDNCEVINKIEGCWVKVMDSQRLVGYSFGGYLQY